ncbi:MAG: diaminopimelate epimerase [Alphaproteobacteria bacterium]|nr:diaminopimelate epimerase [Alphaproteobacteria bacterium]
MERPFLKMHGLGNDFAVFDARTEPLALDARLAKAIADRRRGIGCDQVVVLARDGEGTQALMRIFNADGSEVARCGNAERCVGWLLMCETGQAEARFRTKAERLVARHAGERLVTVDMGPPRLDWREVPLAEAMDTDHLPLEVGPRHARTLADPAAVGMGNPHCVFFAQDLSGLSIEGIGPQIEHHPLFPERTNVSFARVLSRERIRLRVWERGAGVTQACGTAAAATLVAANRRGLVGRKAEIELDGGTLTLEWAENEHVLLTGPVALAFEGKADLEALAGAAR